MRIWILNHYALPPDRAGGTRHYEFGRLLAGQGHDVTIFASSFNHFSQSEERLPAGERLRVQLIDGVRFAWIRTTPYQRNDHRRMLNMASYAAGVLGAQHRFPRPDVVVGSCVHPMAVAAAWLIGAVRRAPFVFEVRDLWPQTLIDMGALSGRGAAARVLRAAERFLYHRARLVISLLPGAAGYITASGVPEEKIIYIPNGIAKLTPAPPGPATSALASQIRQLREAGARLVAGYVGSHGAANGVDVLVRAAAVLRDRGVGDIALVLVGDGPDKQRCERLAEALALGEDSILFASPVPKREVPALLEALDVTLFPLRDVPVFRYGLSSNKLFDYLASGRPVICASAPGDNPVRASGGGICVPPEVPEAVADALGELAAAGPEARRAIGEQGKVWVYRHHDMAMLADRFLGALESVVK
jgi:glycosyltransferase involved in cell wall biosynthesis